MERELRSRFNANQKFMEIFILLFLKYHVSITNNYSETESCLIVMVVNFGLSTRRKQHHSDYFGHMIANAIHFSHIEDLKLGVK